MQLMIPLIFFSKVKSMYVKNLKSLSFFNSKNMMKLLNQENYLITKLCIHVRNK